MANKIIRSLVTYAIRDHLHDLADTRRRLRNVENALDTLIESPVYRAGDEVGFNGQLARKALFRALIERVGFDSIIETGTWVGNTAGFMAQTAGLPVFTTEVERRFYFLARSRLAGVGNIRFELGDSRAFLRALAATGSAGATPFVYLDAHWYEDLPLIEEIDVIAAHWRQFVIMIDDFQVPGDAGYSYDRYGDLALSLDYIRASLERHALAAYFPATPAAQETGARSGCVVLARRNGLATALDQLALLRAAGED
jgi:predicted O-methyltransferase YrrM